MLLRYILYKKVQSLELPPLLSIPMPISMSMSVSVLLRVSVFVSVTAPVAAIFVPMAILRTGTESESGFVQHLVHFPQHDVQDILQIVELLLDKFLQILRLIFDCIIQRFHGSFDSA